MSLTLVVGDYFIDRRIRSSNEEHRGSKGRGCWEYQSSRRRCDLKNNLHEALGNIFGVSWNGSSQDLSTSETCGGETKEACGGS